MNARATQSRPRLPAERLPGERYWWIDGRGRVLVSDVPARVVGTALAEGRVSEASGMGVIERINGADAALGRLCFGMVGLLDQRFVGMRWAIADPERAWVGLSGTRRCA